VFCSLLAITWDAVIVFPFVLPLQQKSPPYKWNRFSPIFHWSTISLAWVSGAIYTTLQKFENGSFTLKAPGKFLMPKNSVGRSTWLSQCHGLPKATFSKCFPSTRKQKASGVPNSSGLKSVFQKLRLFSWRISVDGRSNRRGITHALPRISEKRISFTLSDRETEDHKLQVYRAPGGGGGVVRNTWSLKRGESAPRSKTLALLYTISAEKVPLLYTFYWKNYPFYIPTCNSVIWINRGERRCCCHFHVVL